MPLHLEADFMRYDHSQDILTAEGQVSLAGEALHVEADRLVYDRGRGQLEATGVRRFEAEGVSLAADSLLLNLDARTGQAANARIQGGGGEAPGFQFEAEAIRRMEGGQWTLADASGTTCRCRDESDSVPWSVASDAIHLTEQGYATCEDFTFRIAGLPVFYLPYALLPAKSRAATGLLLPKFGYSNRKGFGAALPFHVAVSDGFDLTLTPRIHGALGAGAQAGARWSLHGDGAGTLTLDYQDMSRREDRTDVGALSTSQRYRLDAGETLTVAGLVTSRAGYRRWLGDGLGERLQPYDAMRAFWRHDDADVGLSLEAAGFVQREGIDIEASDRDSQFHQWRDDPAVTRMPRMSAWSLTRPLLEDWPVYWTAGADAQMVHFHNQPDAESPGHSRQVGRAAVTAGFLGGWRLADVIEVVPHASFTNTAFNDEDQPGLSPSWQRAAAGIDMGAGVHRVFGDPGGPRWRHRMEWRWGYGYENIHREHPTPALETADLREAQPGPYAVWSHHLQRKDGEGRIQRWLQWEVRQRWLQREDRAADAATPLESLLWLTPLPWARIESEAAWDWAHGEVSDFRVLGSAGNERGDTIGAAWRREPALDLNYVEGRATVKVTEGLALLAATQHDLEAGRNLSNDYGFSYDSACRCWRVEAAVFDRWRGDPPGREYGGRLQLTLTGLGEEAR